VVFAAVDDQRRAGDAAQQALCLRHQDGDFAHAGHGHFAVGQLLHARGFNVRADARQRLRRRVKRQHPGKVGRQCGSGCGNRGDGGNFVGKARGHVQREGAAHGQAGDAQLARTRGQRVQVALDFTGPVQVAGGAHVFGRGAVPGQARAKHGKAKAAVQLLAKVAHALRGAGKAVRYQHANVVAFKDKRFRTLQDGGHCGFLFNKKK